MELTITRGNKTYGYVTTIDNIHYYRSIENYQGKGVANEICIMPNGVLIPNINIKANILNKIKNMNNGGNE